MPDQSNQYSVGTRDVTHWATPLGRQLANAHHRLTRRVGARRSLATSLAVGLGVAAASTIAATRVYDAVAGSNGIESLDKPILERAKQLRSPALDTAAAGIARAFGPVGMPVLTIGTAVALGIRERSRMPVVVMTAAGAGSLLMTLGGKDMVHRHRPDRREAIPPYERSPSFPSGHTLNATTIATVLGYLLMLRQRRIPTQVATASAAAGTAAAVGLSRVLLGAHWFTDVLMGWAAGGGWASLVITSHRLYLTTERGRPGQ
jgi:undecaprenyl-diphosphatase